MRFIKMHGTGNDYVYINGFEQPSIANLPQLARAVSHRHFGIGSDGLILIQPTSDEDTDAEMVMYNADGSVSEMCGNGLRCVAKYVHDHIVSKEQLRLRTGAGIKKAQVFKNSQGFAEKIQIDMGTPVLEGLAIPTTWELPRIIQQEITAGDRTFSCTCVSMGNPHCVIYVEDVEHFPVEKYGPILENHSCFPHRINVEFVEVVNDHELIQRTWERGSGETWACGTGASAVCVAGVLTGHSAPHVTIHLLGGDLELDYSDGKTVKLTGNAVEVFTGDYPWSEE